MSRKNKKLDWTNFTDTQSAMEFQKHSIASSAEFDIHASRDPSAELKCVALTSLVGQTELEMGISGSTEEIGRYIFKGYIPPELNEWSPHSFITNPCDLAEAGDEQGALDNMMLCTTFEVSAQGDQVPVIAPGTICLVQLYGGDWTYNYERGRFLEVRRTQAPSSDAAAMGAKCDKIKDVFEGMVKQIQKQDAGQRAASGPSGIQSGMGGKVSGGHSRSKPDSDLTPEIDWVRTRFDVPVGRYSGKDFKPSGITIHYTAGGSASGAIRTLAKRGLSYHFIISKDGTIDHLVRTNSKAIHDPKTNCCNIGVSFVNLGYQEKYAGKYGAPPIEEWVEGPDTKGKVKKWDPYPQAQVDAYIKIKNYLESWYGTMNIQLHSEVSTSGKQDPGPAFTQVWNFR
mgnify:CR=1 FL=1